MTSPRLRIAIVSDSIFPYHHGGKEVRYHELANRLKKHADVHIYTMHWWNGPRTHSVNGITLHAISPRLQMYRGGRRSILQAVLFAVACLKLITARFDILEADQIPYFQLFPLRLVASLRRKRFVATWHEVWGKSYWRHYLGAKGVVAAWIERWSVHLPDHVIAASAQTAERLCSELGRRDEITIAPNGIDLSAVDAAEPAVDRRDTVFVGRFLEHKRLDMVLNVLARLRGEGLDITCRIIGDGPEKLALQKHAAALGVGDLVDFRHDVRTQKELYSLVKASRVFVFPSAREGFGIAALEAMACGLPVVTTDAPDNLSRFVVARSARGVVCRDSVESMASALRNALTGAPVASVIPREEWVTEYDWSAVAAQVLKALAS